MDKKAIKDYILGKFSKEILLKRHLPMMQIVFWTLLLIAYLLFPPELNYSMFERSISNLGSYTETQGATFFSIAIIFFGISLFPIFLYFFYRFKKICKCAAYLGVFFGILGCIFIVLIGIVSDDPVDFFGMDQARVHVYIAAIGILGIGLGMLTYVLPILKDTFFKRGHRQFPLLKLILTYSILIFAILGMGIAELIKAQYNYDFPGPGFLSFTFWEWMLLITFNIFLIFFSVFIPDKIKGINKKEKNK